MLQVKLPLETCLVSRLVSLFCNLLAFLSHVQHLWSSAVYVCAGSREFLMIYNYVCTYIYIIIICTSIYMHHYNSLYIYILLYWTINYWILGKHCALFSCNFCCVFVSEGLRCLMILSCLEFWTIMWWYMCKMWVLYTPQNDMELSFYKRYLLYSYEIRILGQSKQVKDEPSFFEGVVVSF